MSTTTLPFADVTSVRAAINYIGEMRDEPYMYYREPPPGAPYTNVVDDPHEVDIADLRGHTDLLTLDRDGIAFVRHGHGFKDFSDDDAIRSAYYRDVEQMFRDLLGVETVIAYDFSVRMPDHGAARPAGIPVAGTRRRPIKRAHGDFIRSSFEGFIHHFADRLGPDALSKRCRAFNFWRALRGPLTDGPLALCHPSTVAQADLVPMRQYNDPKDNYICALRYNPDHRWCYLSGMEADEGVIFSSYDNRYPEPRGVVTHSAFDDPTRPADGLPRESIEVRVLVVDE